MSLAKVVLTDSGGIQEETTILGVPCITLRENTERPVTLTHGTNVLVGSDCKNIIEEFRRVVNGQREIPSAPQLWDGHAARRLIQILIEEETDPRGCCSRPVPKPSRG
jgi:UDP-N-acetylglucosamine 2-epimerase (non-hydrolysing)